jgi:hypothetical protein
LPLLVLVQNREQRAVLNHARGGGTLFHSGLKEIGVPAADEVAVVAEA